MTKKEQLINDAAEATERFGDDELERWTEQNRIEACQAARHFAVLHRAYLKRARALRHTASLDEIQALRIAELDREAAFAILCNRLAVAGFPVGDLL